MRFGGIFDYDEKSQRLIEVERELENPDLWSNPEQAEALGIERAQLEAVVSNCDEITAQLRDAQDLLQLAQEDTTTFQERDIRRADSTISFC